MRELLYTKHRQDYAYFEIVDGKKRKVDATAFSLVENQLLDTGTMCLPENRKVNGSFAYYYDALDCELKCVEWNYSTEKDTRGYVESRFRTAAVCTELEVEVSEPLLEQIKTMLVNLFLYIQKHDSGIIRCSLGQLFGPKAVMDIQPKIFPILALFYRSLPTKYAQKLIFINKYREPDIRLEPLTFSTDQISQKVSLGTFDAGMTGLLQQIENIFEYAIVLRYFWMEAFHYEITGIQIRTELTKYQKMERILSFWNKLRKQNSRSVSRGIDSIKNIIFNSLIAELNALRRIPDFPTLLEEYRETLHLFRQPEYADVLHSLQSYLSFRNIYRPETPNLKEAFMFVRVMGKDILPDDKLYYSELCLSAVLHVDSGEKLERTIHHTAECSVGEFFSLLTPGEQMSSEVYDLFLLLANHLLKKLQTYTGYCNDPGFMSLSKELDAVASFSKACDFGLEEFLFREYAVKCKNVMQLINLASYYLSDNMTLQELLAFVQDWRFEDFYTRVNLCIFDALIVALSRVTPDETNKEEIPRLMVFLQRYKEFRILYDELVEPEKPVKDINECLRFIYEKNEDLVKLHINVYNNCTSEEAKQILVFVSKNILGNPAILLFMMYAFRQTYFPKIKIRPNNAYTYYYQLLELLLSPIINEGTFTFEDYYYLVMMFERNDKLPKSSSETWNLFGDAIRKVRDAGPLNDLLRIHKNSSDYIKDFISLLIRRLRQRYRADKDMFYVSEEVDEFSQRYLRLINSSELSEYRKYYVGPLQDYFIELIKL